jgi:hypothetical protein
MHTKKIIASFGRRVFNFARRNFKTQLQSLRDLPYKKFDTRIEMLSLLPQGAVIAELGVFKGDFSAEILNICKPRELVLVDIWSDEQIISGDVNGENVQVYKSGAELYPEVLKRFGNNPAVKIIKAWSSHIETFPDNYFDAIYVDADHEYPGALRDLETGYKKIKHGGWLMGHDYQMNYTKSTADWKFGVKRSADEFCEKYNQKITVKGMDGCVSFGIKINK